MGNTKSNDKEISVIDESIKRDMEEDMRTKHVLLLGAGSVGKSTIFKALNIVYQSTWTGKAGLHIDEPVMTRGNLVTGLKTLLNKSSEFYEQDNIKYADCFIDLDKDQELKTDIEYLGQYNYDSFNNTSNIDSAALKKLSGIMDKLWKLKQVQKVYKLRYLHSFSFFQNFDYWMDKIEDVMSEDYVQTDEDRLKLRIRTTGLLDGQYDDPLTKKIYDIYDTGGERSERRKWIHSFDGKDAVIFVISLNQFYKELWEDESKNAMKESMDLWQEIGQLRWFKNTPMFVVLNKTDLFKKALRYQSLKFCFGDEYKGRNCDDSIAVHPNVIKRVVLEMMEVKNVEISMDICGEIMRFCDFRDSDYWLNEVCQDGIKFITNKVLEVREDAIVYPLCAINVEEVGKMMKDVHQRILTMQLKSSGLV